MIHKKLHAIRKRKGLTVKQLSEKTGLSRMTINNAEQGKHDPKHGNVIKILKALDYELRLEDTQSIK